MGNAWPNLSPQLLEGGSDSWKHGDLRRYLKPVRLANISSGSSSSVAQTFRVQLQGLSDVLTAHVAVGIVTANTANNQDPILPSAYPATPGTMQLTPVVKSPEVPRLYVREVFQDPTVVTNIDAPLPQEIPFGWSFEPEGADEVRIDVVIPQNAYAGTSIDGVLVCLVTISYTGDWQDTQAVSLALSRPRLSANDGDNLPTIGSGGG